MHINHHSVSSRYCGSKYFHFPYCNMDKFIIKGKRKINEKSESDDSVEPRTLKSATDSGVPETRSVISLTGQNHIN
jgi:hypothetical protein